MGWFPGLKPWAKFFSPFGATKHFKTRLKLDKRIAGGLPTLKKQSLWVFRQLSSDQRLHSEFLLGFPVKNRQQLARPARSHKIVHLLLRVGKFIEALGIDHNDRE